MTDGESPEKQPDQVQRDANGRVLPGSALNPEGKNGHLQGWTPYGKRLQRYLQMPFKVLKATLNDEAALDELSSVDIIAIQQAADMIKGENRRQEREAGLDRIEGKARQSVVHGGDPDNRTPIAMDGVFTLKFGTDGNDADKPEG